MACETLDDGKGGTYIVCMRRVRSKRCLDCGRSGAAFLCDGPKTPLRYPRKSGSRTCDKPICQTCATEVGPDRHVCREHVRTGAAPEQTELGL
jgi:hypothetical protein